MVECGTVYMGMFALGQMIIPVGFGLWWVTWVGVPVLIDKVDTYFLIRRLTKEAKKRERYTTDEIDGGSK